MRGTVVRAGFVTGAAYVAHVLVPLKGFVLAAMFSPDQYGVLVAFTTMLAWLAYSDLGLFHAQNREIPMLRGAGQEPAARRVASLAQGGTYVFAAVVFVLFEAVALVQYVDALPGSAAFTAALGAAILAQQVAGFPNSLCFAERKFVLQSSANVVGGLVDVGVTLAAAILFGLPGVLAVVPIAFCVEAVVFHRYFGRPLRPSWSRRPLLTLIAMGIPIELIWFSTTSMVAVDKVVTLAYLGKEQLGLYALAGAASTLIMVAPQAIGGMLSPRILERLGAGAGALLQLSLSLDVVAVIGGCLAPIAIIVLPPATELLLPAYVDAVNAGQVLCLASTVLAGIIPTTPYLIGLRKYWRTVALLLTNAGVNVLIDIAILEAGFGITGVAVGSLISYVWLSIALQAWVFRGRGALLRTVRSLLPPLWGGVVGFSLAIAIERAGGGIPLALAGCLVAAVLCLPLAYRYKRYILTSHAELG